MIQAITLRLITRQAGGGEIVRTRRIDAGEALIGRAPHCDIHLPDLSGDARDCPAGQHWRHLASALACDKSTP